MPRNKLYHGTSERYLSSILSNGLLPRTISNQRSNWEHSIESSDDRVYLTKGYAPYFAYSACEENERWLIVEVDKDILVDEFYNNVDAKLYTLPGTNAVDEAWELFFPDEDYVENILSTTSVEKLFDVNPKLAEALVSGNYPENSNPIEKTRWIRNNIDLFERLSVGSLEKLGNISWRGVIPPRAISRISLYDPKSNPHMTMAAIDPVISVMNWSICSKKYEEITRWFLGYKDIDPMLCSNTYVQMDQDMKSRASYLGRIVEAMKKLDPEDYVQSSIEIDGKSLSIKEAGGLVHKRKASDPVSDMLDSGGHKVKEVLERAESQLEFIDGFLDRERAWKEEIIPDRSGVEIIDTAQMGVGGMIKCIPKEVGFEILGRTFSRYLDEAIAESKEDFENLVPYPGDKHEWVKAQVLGNILKQLEDAWKNPGEI